MRITMPNNEERKMNDVDVAKHAALISSLAAAPIWTPALILAVPAAIYYCILVYEKVTGKKFSELFFKE